MPYQCFTEGCPADHESKWQVCTLPDDDPLVRARMLLYTQFIAGTGLTDQQALILDAAIREIERLRGIPEQPDTLRR